MPFPSPSFDGWKRICVAIVVNVLSLMLKKKMEKKKEKGWQCGEVYRPLVDRCGVSPVRWRVLVLLGEAAPPAARAAQRSAPRCHSAPSSPSSTSPSRLHTATPRGDIYCNYCYYCNIGGPQGSDEEHFRRIHIWYIKIVSLRHWKMEDH